MDTGTDQNIVIVGGGVIGLSIAREVKRSGASRVTVVERGSIGQEASWAAAGMLAPQAEAAEADVFFRMCSASRDLYPRLSTDLLEETGVDIELDTTGTLYLGFQEADSEELIERDRWQSEAGLEVESLTAAEVLESEPNVSQDVVLGLYFPSDWQVENRRLLFGLQRYAELAGIELVEQTSVQRVITKGGRAAGVRSDGGDIPADTVILAGGAWTSAIEMPGSEVSLDVTPIRGQIISYEAEELFSHVIYSKRGYLVPRRDGRVLAGSTSEDAGFEKTTTKDAARELSSIAAEIAPSLSSSAVMDHWAGLRPYSADGLPIIGAVPDVDGLLIATAHYRNGILLAPLTAQIIARSVLCGEGSEYLSEFGPARVMKRSVTK